MLFRSCWLKVHPCVPSNQFSDEKISALHPAGARGAAGRNRFHNRSCADGSHCDHRGRPNAVRLWKWRSSSAQATINYSDALVADSAGNLYIADTLDHQIRKIDATTGIATAVAGTGQQGYFATAAADSCLNPASAQTHLWQCAQKCVPRPARTIL